VPASAYAARMSHPTDRPPPEAPTRPGWVPRRPVPGARPSWAVPAGLLATAAVYPAAFQLHTVPFWPALAALAAVSWWAAWHPYLPVRLRPSRRLDRVGLHKLPTPQASRPRCRSGADAALSEPGRHRVRVWLCHRTNP